MAERPVQGAAPPHAEPAAANGAVPPAGYPAYFSFPWRPERPKVVIKADLLPAVSVLSTVSLLGLAVGWLWSMLAPAQRMIIGQDGKPVVLAAVTGTQAESFHRFDDLVVFTLLGLGAGLFTGLAVWFLRERRGPVIMIAAVLGSTLGGWLAVQVGVAWAEGRYPVSGDVKVLDVILKAPQLESGWILLAWPLTTALAYGVMAAWNSMDDLGRRLG
ncbi:DUF2567 domain-containing protein [Actinophytocola sp.]|uniref:DUF2567 domain-containing protein n=1 Tax=Actinophytocola sp. TaxID=1872138 RepID=UPI0025C22FF0|nr:DUF2567 domain-containing protein [Actinophytocola sp.]